MPILPRRLRSSASADEASPDDAGARSADTEQASRSPARPGDAEPGGPPGTEQADDGAPLPDPPPVGRWAPDVLGDGFVAQTLPLLPDEEGEVAATLVRHLPEQDPRSGPAPATAYSVLYLHGWNDYFNQRELARAWSGMGAAFYALDLRKYGRSLRAHQSRGYVDALSAYDEDLHAALAVIRAEQGAERGLVLMGHSTGGLVAALWAHRHPGALRALVLNSPWLELQGSSIMRTLSHPVVDRLARYQPKAVLPLIDLGHYSRILAGVRGEDTDADIAADAVDDPFVTGWDLEPAWRTSPAPVRAGWLSAVMTGHAQVAAGLSITVPILVLTSDRTIIATRWSDEMRAADVVLDVELVTRRALQLGPVVTVVRIKDAIHDVTLSAAPARAEVYREISRWARAYVARGA